MGRLSPLNTPVAEVKRSHTPTQKDDWELRLSKVKIHCLYWCEKQDCDHKPPNCHSVNLIVPKEGWQWWVKKHHFCTKCRRREF